MKRENRFRRSAWGASAVYTCRECGKKTRETGDCESGVELCKKCYHEAGLENEHYDGYHDDEKNDACPLCRAKNMS